MLIEQFIEDMVRKYGRGDAAGFCGRVARELLDATSHLVKVSSVARGVATCVFIPRLIEVMGVRGLYKSVLPGKGVVTHQLLAIAFPRIVEDVVTGELSSRSEIVAVAERRVNEAHQLLDEYDALYSNQMGVVSQAKEDAVLMSVNAILFLIQHANRVGVSLDRARVYTELSLMSYRLHLWGVADAIVEDPNARTAIIFEWKSERARDEKTPRVVRDDVMQAYGYALLEADRLGYDNVFQPVLEGRIVAAVVRPVVSRGAIPVYTVYPDSLCSARSCWKREELRELLELMVLLAEHLTLVMASKELAAQVLQVRSDVLEATCSAKTKTGRERPVFNRIPEHPAIKRLMHNPLKAGNRWPCNQCPYRDACIYYVFSGNEPEFAQLRREAWRARYAVMRLRENALRPYREVRRLVIEHGGYDWVKGHVKTRILSDGNRVDLFDEARVTQDAIMLVRRITRYEKQEGIIVTLREGKPAIAYLNEPHVHDPLLRINFYGTVVEAKYDEDIDRIVVKIEPVTPPSRIYLPRLLDLQAKNPDLFRDVLAFEVNVELTHLELLALDAYERGTYSVLSKFDKNEIDEAEKTLALILGGLDWVA